MVHLRMLPLLMACGAPASIHPAMSEGDAGTAPLAAASTEGAPSDPAPNVSPIAAPDPPARPSAAEMEAEIAAVKERIRAHSAATFTVVSVPPWIVIGDGDPDEVRRRAEDTVAWTHQQLLQDFFAHAPDRPWTIWLFDGDESYRTHAKALFDDTPSTPYGYADGDEHALILDITTGGGTLVHEMVHPFIAANLPGCPPWINEGLASLFEHVGQEDGHIHGYVNWRLPGLQHAIRDGRVPALRTLTGLGAARFYADDTGVNYATARYVMQYLQDHDRLRPFMAAYTRDRAADPTGFATLLRVVGLSEEAFTASFTAWAQTLSVR